MKKNTIHLVLMLVAVAFLSTGVSRAQSFEKELDRLFEEAYQPGHPGATVLIAKDGEVLYRKAFGMANLELNVPMKPEHVLELGSITKQFSAVAILMLQEQDKLSLQDPLSKYIADYPKGDKITLHHLLNHTSGIKSYTNMQSFFPMARTDMSPMELIDVFKNEPFEFEPGEDYNYNNSAYILVGYIIEQVSGMPYADFIEKNIFEKLGMKNSYYGSKSKLIPMRASGYQPVNEGTYRNADYLSMTLPYAAGSLMSNVDDMLLWSQAVHNNGLISEKSKQLAFATTTLNDGKTIYYGYGWSINELAGSPTLEHGGGIFGYTTSGLYAPKENLYIIVLTNTNGKDPGTVSLPTLAMAMGKPLLDDKEVYISEEVMKQWVGTYDFDGVLRFITYQDGSLYSQREGSQVLKLISLSEHEYRFENSFTTYTFSNENGKRVASFTDRIQKDKGIETDKKPAEKKAITVAAEILEKYQGDYELQPGFIITIHSKTGQLFAQATGQPQFELYAETPETFFAKITPLSITFNKNDKAEISSLTLLQGGQQMEAKKIK